MRKRVEGVAESAVESGQDGCSETWCVRQQSRAEWIGLERDMHSSHAVKSIVWLQWRVEGVIVTEGGVRCSYREWIESL